MIRLISLLLALWLASFSTASAWFFTPSGFGNGVIKAGGASTTPSSLWLFDESGGTTVADQKGVSGLTQTNGTLGSGKLVIDGSTANNIWNETSAGYATALDGDFTIYVWFKPVALATDKTIVQLSSNSNLTSAYQFRIASQGTTSSTLRTYISNGTTTTSVDNAGILNTSNKVFIAVRYTRTGGAADNVLRVDATADCSTWVRSSSSSQNLMQNVAGHVLRNKGASSGTNGHNGEYYKMALYDGTLLGDGELTTLCQAGSE